MFSAHRVQRSHSDKHVVLISTCKSCNHLHRVFIDSSRYFRVVLIAENIVISTNCKVIAEHNNNIRNEIDLSFSVFKQALIRNLRSAV